MLRAERDLARARLADARLADDDGGQDAAVAFAAAISTLREQSTPYHLATGCSTTPPTCYARTRTRPPRRRSARPPTSASGCAARRCSTGLTPSSPPGPGPRPRDEGICWSGADPPAADRATARAQAESGRFPGIAPGEPPE